MNYIASDKILIFPTATRSINSPGQYITEYNLANIINRLVDRDAFVISNNQLSDSLLNSPLEFNMYGYYVKVNDVNSLISSLTDKPNTGDFYIIATMKIENLGNNIWEIYSQENPPGSSEPTQALDTNSISGNFTGVSFSVVNDLDSVGDNDLKSNYFSVTPNTTSITVKLIILYAKYTIDNNNGIYTYSIPNLSRVKYKIDDGELGKNKN